MNCRECQNLIGKYRNGEIGKPELSALREHIGNCPLCGKEFEMLAKVKGLVTEAFQSKTRPADARTSIMSRLPSMRSFALHKRRFDIGPSLRKWIPAISGGLVIVGILIGFELKQITTARQSSIETGELVPMQVSGLEGMVLVKHGGSEIWEELKSSSAVYLADVFQSSAKSKVSLLFGDRSKVTLDSNSILALKVYDGGVEFRLDHGTLKASLSTSHPPFIVRTAQGRVEALGTEFTVSVR